MISYYEINGVRLPREEARIGLEDIGLLRGYGVFDFFRFRNGRPVFGEAYLARFARSAELLGLPLPAKPAELGRRVQALIDANGLADGAIQLVLTGGYSPDNYEPAEPNLLILQRPAPAYGPEHYERGVRLMLFAHQREAPHIKTTNYLTGIRLLKTLRAAGALEPLYHYGAKLRETVRSNVFVVDADGVVCTPAREVLPGVTRSKVLELARRRYPVAEREIGLEELAAAREVFLSSTTKRLMPVVQIDDLQIGTGRPGAVFRTLAEDFSHLEAAYLDSQKLNAV